MGFPTAPKLANLNMPMDFTGQQSSPPNTDNMRGFTQDSSSMDSTQGPMDFTQGGSSPRNPMTDFAQGSAFMPAQQVASIDDSHIS
jgi:hypothetical protein